MRWVLKTTQLFADGTEESHRRVYDMEEGEIGWNQGSETPWMLGALVYLSDCDNVTKIDGRMRVIDRDPLTTNDRLATLELTGIRFLLGAQPTCDVLDNLAGLNRWGVADSGSVVDDEPVLGQTLSVGLRFMLRLDVR